MSMIIVTAEKREQSLGEVGMSVTVLDAESLTSIGFSEPRDLQKLTPDLFSTVTPYGAPIYSLRGIGYFDEALGAAPTVTVYVDQVPLPFSRMAEGAGLDVERVEILKGPQGTLFGQNSTGGAINFVATKPTEEFESGVRMSAGSFDYLDAEFHLGGPVTDQVQARLAIRTERSDGWQESVSRDATLGARRFDNARLLIDYTPSDRVALEFNANGWINRSDTQAGQFLAYSPTTPPANGGFSGSPMEPDLAARLSALPPAGDRNRLADWDPGVSFRRDDRFGAFSLRGDFKVSDRLEITSISAYSSLRVLTPSDDDGTRFVDLRVTVDGRLSSVSQELRLSGRSEKIHWVTGANYQGDTTQDLQRIRNQGTNSGLFNGRPLEYRYYTLGNRNDQDIDARAIFAGADIAFSDALGAELSARHTLTRRGSDGCLLDGGDGQFGGGFGLLSNVLNGIPSVPAPGDAGYIGPGQCATLDPTTNRPIGNVHSSVREENTSWRAGLNWNPAQAMLLYANVTQGFKSGNSGTLPLVYPSQAASVPAEKLIAYEAGVRSQALEGRIELNGAVFLYDYSNKQLLGNIDTGQIFGNLPGEVSIPKSRVWGVEMSAAYRPTRSFIMSLSAIHLDSEVTRNFLTSPPVSSASGPIDVKGEAFPYTPEWSAVANLEYRRSLQASWRAYAGANLVARGPTTSAFAANRDFVISNYCTLDVRAGIARADDTLRIELWGRNITDRYYWTSVARIQDTIYRMTAMPATYGITISAHF